MIFYRSLENKIILESLVSIQAEIERTVQEMGITLNTCKNESELPTALRQCLNISAITLHKSAQCVEQAKANMETQKVAYIYITIIVALICDTISVSQKECYN